MSVNYIKLRIEGQLKNQTNYVKNNARLICVDALNLTNLSCEQKAMIKALKNQIQDLEDPWTWSGVPDLVKTDIVLNYLKKLETILY